MMWNSQPAFDADALHAIRKVVTGEATAEQAATACGLTAADIRAVLAACPQARLQEVEASSTHRP